MRVVITGGAGFLGQRLANRILALGKLVDSAGEERDVTRLVLNDIAEPVGGLPEDERWDPQMLQNMQGTPQRPDPRRPGSTIPIQIRFDDIEEREVAETRERDEERESARVVKL